MKPAHPKSAYSKFWDEQGLAAFALLWNGTKETLESEVRRRWQIQVRVNTIQAKADQGETGAASRAGCPAK